MLKFLHLWILDVRDRAFQTYLNALDSTRTCSPILSVFDLEILP
jgi:hypothetical protein